MTSLYRGNFALAGIALLALAGCATTPQQTYSELADQSLEQTFSWQGAQNNAVEAMQLTDLMNIPELNDLIVQALDSNPGVQQTLLALKMAYAQRTSTTSDSKPSVTAGFDAYKEDGSDTTFSPDVTVSWEMDIWKRLADNSSAAAKDIASSAASLQSARDTLAADIMRAWLQIAYQQQVVEIQSARLKVLDANESIILEQYRAGLGDLDDLDTARTSSATARSSLASYSEELASSKRDLTLLVGLLGQDLNLNIGSEFPEVMTPLASLPEQDLARRPDLQSAYLDIEAEDYRAKAAYKDMLPSLSLSASVTDSNTSLVESLFTDPVWSLLGSLSAPVFNAGSLKASAEIAELTAENAYWAYQETLLTAVYEVEEALGQENSLALQQQHLEDALKNAQSSFQHYQENYREGLVDISDLISSQTSLFDAQAQLAQAKFNRLYNRISLGLALGLGV
ncbi:TolC family protein [Reinekea marinisedimentorum]|uniref:NodT family efflux transporter outer membrane factor (OMF) lipoprotein n=1 Tax=Reinekea marinisedimentorum TaxID=230495 RepID=A0A4R3IA80_9GAMM|nr:TolC family protein [Reinekea marinisedimentorum]TCS43339.1 NodT family efflux transporter outer membrane factor (OMF) lipoprotein [Reinekea marinisedimentorum]